MATKVSFKVNEFYSIRGINMECLKSCQLETMAQTKYVIAIMCNRWEVFTDNGEFDHLECEHPVVVRELTESGRSIKTEKVFNHGSFAFANAYYTDLIKNLL